MRLIVLLWATLASTGLQADWKPAPGPLSTRWASDVDPTNPLPEYPRPQMARKEWMNLNGLWQFDLATFGEKPPVGRVLPRKILVPYPVESSLSGVGEKAAQVWYRRTFNVDPWINAGKRVLLHFGAVDWESNVWVNGKHVGDHQGGYDGFSFDITDCLKPNGEQEIVVGVWDPSDQGTQPCGKQAVKPEGIWYTSVTGIWQTVWIEPVSSQHVTQIRLMSDIDKGTLRAEIDVAGPSSDAIVSLVVRDPNQGNAPVAGERFRVDPRSKQAVAEINIPNLRLWSPDEPNLYPIEITLDGEVPSVDQIESYVGMRKISVAPDKDGIPRILLNNKFVFQIGPLDQGYWPDGLYTAPTDEALRYDIEITKQLGFNMTRKHVKIEPDRWYYWTDKLGLLVWQDMPSGDARVAPGFGEMKRSAQSARQFETEFKALIDGRRNHPSIVSWVIFNEGWGQYDTRRIADWTKAYDPSRLVNSVSGWNDRKVGDMHDIHHYPPPKSPPKDAVRAIVNGEYGGLGLAVESHTWQAKNNWGYQTFKTQEEIQAKYAAFMDQIRVMKGNPGLSAAVYTQITDVEIETNGLLTYDRAILKGDLYTYRAINASVHAPPPVLQTLLTTSAEKKKTWRYTFDTPSEGWIADQFDDSTWKQGEGAFGKWDMPNTKVRTQWESKDIWLRTTFDAPSDAKGAIGLMLYHDDEVEIYLNGKEVIRRTGWNSDYEMVLLPESAKDLLRVGKNHLAVHCRQDTGGQCFDLGVFLQEDSIPKPSP